MNVVMSRSKYFLFAFFCLVALASCKQIDVFEQNINIPNKKWEAGLVANSSFNIKENGLYKISLVLRHTDAYEYNNIWLDVGLQEGVEKMNFIKSNFQLSNDAFGWDGVGMNDIWEVRKDIKIMRLKKGMFKTSIHQIMRQNPLLHVMNVGIRVEKIGA